MNIIENNVYDVSVALGRTVSARAYRSNGKWYHEHTNDPIEGRVTPTLPPYTTVEELASTGTAELAMHLWAGYQSDSVHDLSSIDNVSSIARFVPSLAKASEDLGQKLHANEVEYAGVFMYDVAQNAGAWLADQTAPIIEDFEAHVNTLVAKGIVK